MHAYLNSSDLCIWTGMRKMSLQANCARKQEKWLKCVLNWSNIDIRPSSSLEIDMEFAIWNLPFLWLISGMKIRAVGGGYSYSDLYPENGDIRLDSSLIRTRENGQPPIILKEKVNDLANYYYTFLWLIIGLVVMFPTWIVWLSITAITKTTPSF